MKKQKRKLNNKGFTLIEVLVVVFILSVLTFMMAMIMPTAAKSFFNVVDSSNSQVLLSTTITELRDELGTATDIEVSGDMKQITYYSANADNICSLKALETDTLREGIYLCRGKNANPQNENEMLVTRATGTYKLTVTFEKIEYNKSTGLITISNLVVHNKDKSKTLSSQEELIIRAEKSEQ